MKKVKNLVMYQATTRDYKVGDILEVQLRDLILVSWLIFLYFQN